MNCKCNKLIIGFIIGIVLPLITAVLLYFFMYKGQLEPLDFLSELMKLNGLGKFLSISVLSNLIVFLIAVNTERLLAARGIVTATLLYGLVVIVFKFLI